MKITGNNKKISKLVLMMLILLLGITGCGDERPILMQTAKEVDADLTDKEESSTDMDTDVNTDKRAEPASVENGLCYVHICGAVVNPGVYQVPAGSRVYEAVKQAGGFTAEASADERNQAEAVSDGEQIRILTIQEAAEAREQVVLSEEKIAQTGSNLVNINTAEEAVLCTLPGIGSGKAASIINYRKEHGVFQKIEDILKVDGIKNGVYVKLKDKITVS